MTPADRLGVLTRVGEALHGESWQRAIARDLGPYHPDGERESIDSRLVRRWVAGDRPVAEWVPSALLAILREAESAAQERSHALRGTANLLESMIERAEAKSAQR